MQGMGVLVRLMIVIAVFQLSTQGGALGAQHFENYTTRSSKEIIARDAVRSWVVTLFEHERFTDLERLSTQYRTSKSRTTSGLWKLTVFHSGISKAFLDRRKRKTDWAKAEHVVKKWLAKYPDSPSPHIAYARIAINHAWSIRGTGGGKNVAPQTVEHFKQHIEIARKIEGARTYLEKNKHIAAKDPHWYVLMAEIAMTQGWPEPRFSKMVSEGLGRSLILSIVFRCRRVLHAEMAR
jgi:hypothetical protein